MVASPVHAEDVSSAWVQALSALNALAPRRSSLHTVVTIDNPTAEDPVIRKDVDQLLDNLAMQPIETVANTIFPVQMAATSHDHAELVRRYRTLYPLLRTRWHLNSHGTYFGRLVAYPTSSQQDGYDQLGEVIRKIELEHTRGNAKTALYEAVVAHADDRTESDADEGESGTLSRALMVYSPTKDKLPVGGFPCLSHCSFQLDRDGRVHALAQYRSQYLVQRAYGNYLGLGRLLAYVCERTGRELGQLTVTAGYAQIEPKATRRVRELLARHT